MSLITLLYIIFICIKNNITESVACGCMIGGHIGNSAELILCIKKFKFLIQLCLFAAADGK